MLLLCLQFSFATDVETFKVHVNEFSVPHVMSLWTKVSRIDIVFLYVTRGFSAKLPPITLSHFKIFQFFVRIVQSFSDLFLKVVIMQVSLPPFLFLLVPFHTESLLLF